MKAMTMWDVRGWFERFIGCPSIETSGIIPSRFVNDR